MRGTSPTAWGPAARIAATAVAIAFTQGCAAADAGDPGPMAEGRALYQANCLTCHGEDARGDGPLSRTLPVAPPSILEHLGHHTQAELVRLIRGGIPPAMPPTALGDDEVRRIVDYVWTLVPESELAALRAMQQHTEAMGEGAAGATMPTMDHSRHGRDDVPEMDHLQHMRESMPGTEATPGEPDPVHQSTSFRAAETGRAWS